MKMVRKVKIKIRKDVSNLKGDELQDLARLERNRYAREWRAKNKDKVKETNARYWARRALKKAEQEAAENDSK